MQTSTEEDPLVVSHNSFGDVDDENDTRTWHEWILEVIFCNGNVFQALSPEKDCCSEPDSISFRDAVKARNLFFMWTFVSYLCWGILTELYSDFFDSVVDQDNYGDASFYSTVAFSMYSITGFVWSPIMATLSDKIGRKYVFVISACLNGITGIVMGLFPGNGVFITMAAIQGLGGKNSAVGYALLVDYLSLSPPGWTGSVNDDNFHQFVFWLIRLGGTQHHDKDGLCACEVTELTVLFNWVYFLQTTGLVAGIFLGDFFYDVTGSLTWSVATSGFLCIPMIPVLAFSMPETLVDGKLKTINLSDIFKSVRSQRKVFMKVLQQWPLSALIFVNFLFQLSVVPLRTIALYWGQWKFGWGTNTQAYILGSTIISNLVGSILGPKFLDYSGSNINAEYSKMVTSMASVAALSCIALFFVTTSSEVIVLMTFFSLGTGCTPAISARISAAAQPNEQGQVQGVNSAVSSLAWAAGSYAFWGMFDASVADDYSIDDHTATTTATTSIWGNSFWIFNCGLMLGVILVEAWIAQKPVYDNSTVEFPYQNL